jgi:general secretion pathway protein H
MPTRSRPRAHRPETSRGFTLIEILVVVVIIAIVATAMMLSVGITGRDGPLEKESERLTALVNYARDKAELQTHEYGLFLHDNEYEFLTYDARKSLWRSVEEDDALRLRELPGGLSLRLIVEGRPVVLKRAQEEKKATDKEEQEKIDRERVPHIMIFSNGDVTPFKLTVEREELGRSVTLASNEQNLIEAQPMQESKERK